MRNIFTEHPHSLNESYFQHFCFACKFGSQMILGGLACITHAIFPFLCKKTASNYLLSMTDDFVCRMSVVEDRVVQLRHSIEKKMCEQNNMQDTASKS